MGCHQLVFVYISLCALLISINSLYILRSVFNIIMSYMYINNNDNDNDNDNENKNVQCDQ